MKQYAVTRRFVDKHTKELFYEGAVIELDKDRAKELAEYIKEVETEPPKKTTSKGKKDTFTEDVE